MELTEPPFRSPLPGSVHVEVKGRMDGRHLFSALPNGLSLVRLAIGLAFPLLPVEWRLAMVVLAILTDLLDGPLARWLDVESDLGRMLDPVADKVFVLLLAGTLFAEAALPWPWALGIAARDLVVLAGAAGAVLRGRWAECKDMRPTLLGKATTAAQFAVLLAAFFWGAVPLGLLIATTALSVAAGVGYVSAYRRQPQPERR